MTRLCERVSAQCLELGIAWCERPTRFETSLLGLLSADPIEATDTLERLPIWIAPSGPGQGGDDRLRIPEVGAQEHHVGDPVTLPPFLEELDDLPGGAKEHVW